MHQMQDVSYMVSLVLGLRIREKGMMSRHVLLRWRNSDLHVPQGSVPQNHRSMAFVHMLAIAWDRTNGVKSSRSLVWCSPTANKRNAKINV